ncbi:MAG: helix-turn-helix transcriptional regulator [Kineosporiaceae bacterium]
MHGWELRERRRRNGLTLAQVGRASGTAQSNISAYERGSKVPAPRTAARVVASIDAGSRSVVHARGLQTFPAAAAQLRRGLREGRSTADLLRVVRQTRSDAKWLQTRADREIFFAEPSTTGDARWDAMLAASAEDLALTTGVDPAPWTPGHVLPTFWFVGSSPSLHAYAFSHTPISMLVRGVMVDPADLVAV